MKLSDISRHLPDKIWSTFQPVLPPAVWCGNGRPPCDNRAVLHGLLYVLVSGIAWEMVPSCFPCGKIIQNRFKRWLKLDCFRTVWQALAQQYEQLRGINWNLPSAKADGAYGNGPTRQRSTEAGFRMRAPRRGQAKSGVGIIRNAVERGHSFLSGFGRVVRRFDRCDRRYLGWIELAACLIFIRAGFFR